MIRNPLKFIALGALFLGLVACSKKGKVKGVIDDGQLHGVAPAVKVSANKPRGMVYIPPGTFHMGQSDEDMNYNFSARNRQVSIPGFWMDATEMTNNQYRQFVYWVRDSLAAKELGYFKSSPGASGGDSSIAIDWVRARTIQYNASNLEKLGNKLILAPDNRLNGRADIDPNKLKYRMETFLLGEAAKRENSGMARKNFVVVSNEPIYPDTLVWMRDFSYSYNDPQTKQYFAHPTYGNYPVVGLTWKQANAFTHWRTHIQTSFLEKRNMAVETDFRLPSEAEWEYAARGGRTGSPYPWGGPYIRNKKGCLLANFKPGRGNYAEDGGFYTVRADAYFPNDYGLYNMAGNVAEWTSSYFDEGAYNFMSDMSPDVRYDAKDNDPPLMKRKVVRGGSWKDVGFYLQTSARTFEYQDSAKSYIGFRCVIDLAPRPKK